MTYPIPYGMQLSNISSEIFDKLPDIPTVLKETHPKVLISDQNLNFLPLHAKNYILTNYKLQPGDGELRAEKSTY